MNNFQQSVVAAIYMDQSTKKRREKASSFLDSNRRADKPDSELFSSLCRDEFDIQPDIVKTMRLGKNNPPGEKRGHFWSSCARSIKFKSF
jgi:hypothetical protein